MIKVATAISLLASGLFIFKTVKSQAEDTANDIFSRIKFDLPFNKIKFEPKIFGPSTLKIDVVVSNNNTSDIGLTNVMATLFTKNVKGELVELARTPPSTKIYSIGKNKKTVISQFPIEIKTLTTITNLQTLLSKPKGQRVLIEFSGYVQGFPIKQKVWY